MQMEPLLRPPSPADAIAVVAGVAWHAAAVPPPPSQCSTHDFRTTGTAVYLRLLRRLLLLLLHRADHAADAANDDDGDDANVVNEDVNGGDDV